MRNFVAAVIAMVTVIVLHLGVALYDSGAIKEGGVKVILAIAVLGIIGSAMELFSSSPKKRVTVR